ncbi:unnamed protein product [Agarophyton chilense]
MNSSPSLLKSNKFNLPSTIPKSLRLCHVRKISQLIEQHSENLPQLDLFFEYIKESVQEIDILFAYENPFVDGKLLFSEDDFNIRFRERSLVLSISFLCSIIAENLRVLRIPSFQHVIEQDSLYTSVSRHCPNIEEFHQVFHPNDFKERFQFSLTGIETLKMLRLSSPDLHVLEKLALVGTAFQGLKLQNLGRDVLNFVPSLVREKGSCLNELCIELAPEEKQNGRLYLLGLSASQIENRIISQLTQFGRFLQLSHLRLILSSQSINHTNVLVSNLVSAYEGRTTIEIGCNDFHHVKKFIRKHTTTYESFPVQISGRSPLLKEIHKYQGQFEHLKKLDIGNWDFFLNFCEDEIYRRSLYSLQQASGAGVQQINMIRVPGPVCDKTRLYELVDLVLKFSQGDLALVCSFFIIPFIVETSLGSPKKWDLLLRQLGKIQTLSLYGFPHCSSPDSCRDCNPAINEFVRTMPIFLATILPKMHSIQVVTFSDAIMLKNEGEKYVQNLRQTLEIINNFKVPFETVDLSMIETQFQLHLEEFNSH